MWTHRDIQTDEIAEDDFGHICPPRPPALPLPSSVLRQFGVVGPPYSLSWTRATPPLTAPRPSRLPPTTSSHSHQRQTQATLVCTSIKTHPRPVRPQMQTKMSCHHQHTFQRDRRLLVTNAHSSHRTACPPRPTSIRDVRHFVPPQATKKHRTILPSLPISLPHSLRARYRPQTVEESSAGAIGVRSVLSL